MEAEMGRSLKFDASLVYLASSRPAIGGSTEESFNQSERCFMFAVLFALCKDQLQATWLTIPLMRNILSLYKGRQGGALFSRVAD